MSSTLLTGSLLSVVTRLFAVPSSVAMNIAFRVTVQAALTIGLAMASWHGFEKPLNDLKRFFPYSGGSPEGGASAVDYANPANAVTRSA